MTGYGHLVRSSLNTNVLATYAYNGFDQRVVKAAATTTDFVFGRGGHVLADEDDAAAAMLREYISMDDTAVAMARDSDGFGDIIQIASPDTGTTVLWYDANGKVTKKVDASNTETDYQNDVLGRVTSRQINGSNLQAVAYYYDETFGGNSDGIGRLGQVTDPTGSTTLWYDPFGNVIEDQRVIGSHTYTAGYQYDAAGHVHIATYPSGRTVTYTRDSFGRISGVATLQNSTGTTILSNGTYEPFGPLATLLWGNGLSLTQGWTEDYYLSSIATGNGGNMLQNLAYGEDPAGNIGTITDNLVATRSQGFGYDPLNRLIVASGVYGGQIYQYDGVGNRKTAMIGGIQYTYTTAPTSNRITEISQPGGSRILSYYTNYTSTGEVIGDQRNASSNYGFGYDGYGHLVMSSLNANVLAIYAYNGFDQRAVKTAAATTSFIYDRAGHMIEEANALTGLAIREYIWMDDTPVAMVDDTGSSPVVYDIHTDHLGRPQKLTNQSGAKVWDGAFDPFGNPAGISGSVTMLLGFPGQYWDSETQLAQNWHRDYDPTIGRYIESDPIGLWGGVNTYTYVANRPLNYVDLEGTGPLGGYIGGFLFAALGGAGGSAIGPEGTAAGVYEGAEEGYAIGSAMEDLINLTATAQSIPCRKTPKQCDIQYDRDSEVCRNLPTNGARGRCWASAADRLAHCIQTNGEVGWPLLITR